MNESTWERSYSTVKIFLYIYSTLWSDPSHLKAVVRYAAKKEQLVLRILVHYSLCHISSSSLVTAPVRLRISIFPPNKVFHCMSSKDTGGRHATINKDGPKKHMKYCTVPKQYIRSTLTFGFDQNSLDGESV